MTPYPKAKLKLSLTLMLLPTNNTILHRYTKTILYNNSCVSSPGGFVQVKMGPLEGP